MIDLDAKAEAIFRANCQEAFIRFISTIEIDETGRDRGSAKSQEAVKNFVASWMDETLPYGVINARDLDPPTHADFMLLLEYFERIGDLSHLLNDCTVGKAKAESLYQFDFAVDAYDSDGERISFAAVHAGDGAMERLQEAIEIREAVDEVATPPRSKTTHRI